MKLLPLALLVCSPALAAPVLGADVALLLKQDASGSATPAPQLTVRARTELASWLELEGNYAFAFTGGGNVATAFTQLHRVGFRPQLVLRLKAGALHLGAGP